MFDIHEISAAPHFPIALKTAVTPTRPENLFALLADGFSDNPSVEISLREGEIFIALAQA